MSRNLKGRKRKKKTTGPNGQSLKPTKSSKTRRLAVGELALDLDPRPHCVWGEPLGSRCLRDHNGNPAFVLHTRETPAAGASCRLTVGLYPNIGVLVEEETAGCENTEGRWPGGEPTKEASEGANLPTPASWTPSLQTQEHVTGEAPAPARFPYGR